MLKITRIDILNLQFIKKKFQKEKNPQNNLRVFVELLIGIEPMTSSLPRMCSTD